VGDKDKGLGAVVVLKSCPNATRPIMSSLWVGWGERSRVKKDAGEQGGAHGKNKWQSSSEQRKIALK
jgi:hypothetical protein